MKDTYAYNYGKLKINSEILARAISNYIELDADGRGMAESNLMQMAVNTLKLVNQCEEDLQK